MKIFRLFFILFFLSVPANAESQIWSSLFKKTTKKTIVKKTTKEVAEDIVSKTIIKEAGERAINRTARSTAIESAAEWTKKAAKESLQHNVDNITFKELKHSAISFSHKNSMRVIGHQAEKEIAGSTTKQLIKSSESSVKRGLKEANQFAVKRAVRTGSREVLTGQLREKLGERCVKEWAEKFATEGFEHKTATLLNDVVANPKLAQTLRNNPALLGSYEKCIEAPTFRNNISTLRYLHSGADKFALNVPKLRKKWGEAGELIFKEEKGICKIFDKTTGDFLGTIAHGENGRVILDCSQTNRKLLNIYPMNNATYNCGPHTWITDAQGRVKAVRYKVNGKETILPRDRDMKEMTSLMEKTKNSYNTNGSMTSYPRPDDQGGHLIPRQSGGTNDAINFVPQNKKCNNGGIWKSAENASSTASVKKTGKTIEVEIDMDYPDKTSLRPNRFKRTQLIDGKPQVVNGEVLNGKIIDNPNIPFVPGQ